MSTATPQPQQPTTEAEEQVIDLRNPLLAAFLALVWPGLGHLYQRRRAKGLLLMACILATFFYGWLLGACRPVYAAMNPPQARHYGYFAQFWVGLPAWPAIIQAAFPTRPLGDQFMAPPRFGGKEEGDNDLAVWYREHSGRLEVGFVMTWIAGLLNVLAIFDAAAGPMGAAPAPDGADKKKPPPAKTREAGQPA